MFSYQAYKRYNKARRKGVYKTYFEKKKEKIVFVSRENELMSCWRFEERYARVDGTALHQKWARGEGPIVRHLCSDGRCVNPLHLVRGTDLENAMDEIEVRDFEIEKMEEILGDYSMRGMDKALVHLTLLPRTSIKLVEERGLKSLYETKMYIREFFRIDYVKRLIESNSLTKDELDMSDKAIRSLKIRDDIFIVTVPGL